jgi:hypothetical protein
MMDPNPLLPAWLTISVGAVVLVILAGHLLALNAAEMPYRRKRIRMVSNALMMLVTPLLAYGLGVAAPAQSRIYVMVWVLIAALVFMIIMLALLDLTTTLRLHRAHLKELRQKIALARAQAIAEMRSKRQDL